MKKLLTILAIASTFAFAEKQTLTIYTYSSFTGKYGPANALKTLFEENCNCTVKFVTAESSLLTLNKVRLEGKKTKADIVLGFDNFSIKEAKNSHLFDSHNQNLNNLNLPKGWNDDTFYPFDYSEFAFIYNKNKLKKPPQSLKELVERQDLSIIYSDPRTSTPGRGLLLWMNKVFGENTAQAWQDLAKHTVTIPKSWSEAYGAYLKGEANMVLSYTTSPLYHQWFENDDTNQVAYFSEGHLMQVEVAGIVKSSKNKKLAQKFLQFLTTPKAQLIISKHNIVRPVIDTDLDPLLSSLPKTKILQAEIPEPKTIKNWLNTWQQEVSR